MGAPAISDLPDFYGKISEPTAVRWLSPMVKDVDVPPRHSAKIRIIGTPQGHGCRVGFFDLPPDSVGLDIWIDDPLVRGRFRNRNSVDRRAVISVDSKEFVVPLTVSNNSLVG